MSPKSTGLAGLAILLLAGCASPAADYPSLAMRDAERLNGAGESEAQPSDATQVETAPSADLLQRLDTLQADADSAHRQFLALAPRATRLVQSASGAAAGSDRWASAQIAIAELDTQRSLTAVSLADLDQLYASQAVLLEQRGFIAETQAAVLALIEEEDRILARLKGGLAQ